VAFSLANAKDPASKSEANKGPIRCFTLHFLPFPAPLSSFIFNIALSALQQDVGGSSPSLPTIFLKGITVDPFSRLGTIGNNKDLSQKKRAIGGPLSFQLDGVRLSTPVL
jgi:hypothetical protein